MGVYDDLRAGATEVIDEMMTGVVTVTRSTVAVPAPETEYDPAPGTAPLIYTANACTFGVTEEFMDDKSLVGDELLCIASPIWFESGVQVAFEPAVKDSFTIDGEAHTCVKLERVPRDGTVTVWLLYLRAG